MKKPCHVVALAAVMIGVAGAEMRTWTDRDGRTGHEAEFVGLEGGVVRLRSVDGETLAVPLDGLSQADREFIRQRAADGPGESTVEQALASVRDVKREMFGRQSSVLGELPGPAELAAAQMLLRLTAQELFVKLTPAAVPAIREVVAEEKEWLDEVDDDFLNLVTQLKGEEARKVTLERIAELEALAERLER